MESKAWYQSKTVWVNVITLLSVAPLLPEFNAILPPAATKYVLAIVAVANLALRLFSVQSPITMRKDGGQ